MSMFADEIWLLIGARASSCSLAVLCRVSRRLNNILTPQLYIAPRLQSATWRSCLTFLDSLSTHPSMTKRLYMGRDVSLCHPMPKTIREDIMKAVEKCLQGQPSLVSIYLNHAVALSRLFSEADGQKVLDSLLGLQKLREVSLVNSEGLWQAFENHIPHFSHLDKLELLGMSRRNCDRVKEVCQVLISSPSIRNLSLSMVGWDREDDAALLPAMITRFVGGDGKRLQLRSLRLGHGFLPVESSTDYLSRLTDLTLLETLRLDNDNFGVSGVVQDVPIEASQFSSAIKVRSITAERLSIDIVELINLLKLNDHLEHLALPRFCDTQPRARMDEHNEFWNPDWYGEDTDGPPEWDEGQLFSQPLEQAGTHWKTVLIGDIFRTSDLDSDVLTCVAQYEQVEELTLPLPLESWPQFRDDILPRLRNLERLFLVGGNNACSYGYRGTILEYKDLSTKSEEEIGELVKQRDQEFAKHMASFAKEIFKKNRSNIASGDRVALLKYVGLGGAVYTCMVVSTIVSSGLAYFRVEADGQEWDYRIVKLDNDEAANLESVREWNESIAELRVGGDENGPGL